jgi:hypothetical protein
MEFLDKDWVAIYAAIVSTYLLFYVFIKAVRDIIDKTPETDDNWFEKTVTFLGQLAALLGKGKRPEAPANAKPIAGESADAVGVKVEEKK